MPSFIRNNGCSLEDNIAVHRTLCEKYQQSNQTVMKQLADLGASGESLTPCLEANHPDRHIATEYLRAFEKELENSYPEKYIPLVYIPKE